MEAFVEWMATLVPVTAVVGKYLALVAAVVRERAAVRVQAQAQATVRERVAVQVRVQAVEAARWQAQVVDRELARVTAQAGVLAQGLAMVSVSIVPAPTEIATGMLVLLPFVTRRAHRFLLHK